MASHATPRAINRAATPSFCHVTLKIGVRRVSRAHAQTNVNTEPWQAVHW